MTQAVNWVQERETNILIISQFKGLEYLADEIVKPENGKLHEMNRITDILAQECIPL